MSQPTVFISYSHQDERWKDRLVKHLEALAPEVPLEVWHDRRIGGGASWREEIQTAIDRSRIAIVLVSVDFLLSKFIREEEVPRLLERRERDGVLVYPVIVKDCGWRKIEWLSSINARPMDGKPLEEVPPNKVNRALAAIANEIVDRLEEEVKKNADTSNSFLETYRRCLSPTYSHWDLAHAGVAQAGGAGSPIEAQLDDMYLPLRLAEGFNLNEIDLGGPVSPEDLLSRERPLVIRARLDRAKRHGCDGPSVAFWRTTKRSH